MKKATPFLLVILLAILSLQNGISQNSDYSKLTISIDPMGFLFFGPALNVGYSVNANWVIKANVRRSSWGLLANKIRSYDDKQLYDFTGMGYAVGANRYMESIYEGYYYGAFISLDIQNTKYAENSDWAWHEKTITYGLLVNGGKRFPLGSMFYIDAGVVIGGGLVRWDWDYDDPAAGVDDPEARSGNSFMPIGALEFAFGIYLF